MAAANDALVALLAETFDLPRRDDHHPSRDLHLATERIAMAGLSAAQLTPGSTIYSARDRRRPHHSATSRQSFPAPDPHRDGVRIRRSRQSVIPDGAIASRAGEIVYVGPSDESDRAVEAVAGCAAHRRERPLDRPGLCRSPYPCDFAGDRREELRSRLAGATYADIAASGGGIVSTVAATRAASEAQLSTRPGPASTKCLRAGRRRARSRADTA